MVREEERHIGGTTEGLGLPRAPGPTAGYSPWRDWSENQQPKQFCPQEVDTGSNEIWPNSQAALSVLLCPLIMNHTFRSLKMDLNFV